MAAVCRGWVSIAVTVAVLAACGSRSPDAGRAVEAATATPIDAGVAEALPGSGLMASMDAAPASPADASLAEIGMAPCEVVVARFLTCPGVPETSKQQMVEAARRWHDEVRAWPDRRERLAGACLEIAKMTEKMLLDLDC